jgi:hypothetical protein
MVRQGSGEKTARCAQVNTQAWTWRTQCAPCLPAGEVGCPTPKSRRQVWGLSFTVRAPSSLSLVREGSELIAADTTIILNLPLNTAYQHPIMVHPRSCGSVNWADEELVTRPSLLIPPSAVVEPGPTPDTLNHAIKWTGRPTLGLQRTRQLTDGLKQLTVSNPFFQHIEDTAPTHR